MAILDGFDLDADISLSELRQEDVLDARLRQHHRLRLRRRSEVLGVVIESDQWRALTAYVRQLEAQVERYEDEAVRGLIGRRAPEATFVEATASTVEAIEREYGDRTR